MKFAKSFVILMAGAAISACTSNAGVERVMQLQALNSAATCQILNDGDTPVTWRTSKKIVTFAVGTGCPRTYPGRDSSSIWVMKSIRTDGNVAKMITNKNKDGIAYSVVARRNDGSYKNTGSYKIFRTKIN